jgi:hypothetical protein
MNTSISQFGFSVKRLALRALTAAGFVAGAALAYPSIAALWGAIARGFVTVALSTPL